MVIGKQVGSSLMVMENASFFSCIVLSIIFTSNDDDAVPLLIVTLNTSGAPDLS